MVLSTRKPGHFDMVLRVNLSVHRLLPYTGNENVRPDSPYSEHEEALKEAPYNDRVLSDLLLQILHWWVSSWPARLDFSELEDTATVVAIAVSGDTLGAQLDRGMQFSRIINKGELQNSEAWAGKVEDCLNGEASVCIEIHAFWSDWH